MDKKFKQIYYSNGGYWRGKSAFQTLAKFKKKTYKYALNIVDVASRYKGSYQLTTKNAKEVAQAFQWIYENTPLTYPKTLIVDDGKESYGDTTKLME